MLNPLKIKNISFIQRRYNMTLFNQKLKQTSLMGRLAIMGILCIACSGWAQGEPWIQKADIPTARFLHSSSVVEGLIYAIGGCGSEPEAPVILPVETYNPATDTWTQKADIPTGRVVLSACAVDGKIYAIGGVGSSLVGLTTVEMYDPATDTWTKKADMPTSRGALSVSAVDGKIYAIGGTRNLTSLSGLSTVEEYDPTTDTWATKADMPTRRLGLCTAVVDGQIIAIGGSTQNPAVPTVEAYDPATDTWTSKTDMPTARRNFATSVVNGKIYAIGGWVRSSYSAFRTVEQYDPATDAWIIKTDLPVVRSCLSTSTVDGRIYAIGGTDKTHPCPALSTVFEYNVESDTATATTVGSNVVGNPSSFKLFQNYPNPFNPTTTITYILPNKGKVKLSVYDMLGREVEVLVNAEQSAGIYQVPFDAANLPSGIYLYKIKEELENGYRDVEIKKLILIK
jgi:N-acetylneuraminic acid mutarotase